MEKPVTCDVFQLYQVRHPQSPSRASCTTAWSNLGPLAAHPNQDHLSKIRSNKASLVIWDLRAPSLCLSDGAQHRLPCIMWYVQLLCLIFSAMSL